MTEMYRDENAGVARSFKSYAEFFKGAAEAFGALEDREKAVADREQTLTDEASYNFEQLKALVKSLTGEQKVELVSAMGFQPVGDDHDADCVAPHARGIRCGCVPPATSWGQPRDVDEFRKETWEDRVALANQWSREGSHGREKEQG
jgi:hypothetical protein